MNMTQWRRDLCALMSLMLAFSLAACGSTSASEGVKYGDDHAMATIADGLAKRFEIVNNDQSNATNEEAKAQVKRGVQAEIDTDTPLKTEQFKDTKLQEKVLSYLNVLQESMDVIDNYMYGSVEYDEQWTKVFDKRTEILKTFVDDYGLKMQSATDQATLDELVANGASAAKSRNEKEVIDKLVSSLKFEKEKEDFGEYYSYVAVGENTSDISFENVSIVVGLYDADGVKTEAYANANLWEPGEKVKFEVVAQHVDAKEIKATVQYYAVAD